MRTTLGLDVGATTIKGALVEGGVVLRRAVVATPSGGTSDEIADAIASCVDELRDGSAATPSSIGLAAAGWAGADQRTMIFSANFPAWHHEPLADRLEQRTGLGVVVENDANAAAWGEFRFGAAAGATSMCYLTLGSGVGGAVIVNGALLRGHHGAAGEIGHAVMVSRGIPCACGRRGCAENYLSGRSLGRRARAALGETDVYARARQGDPTALELYAGLGAFVGVALSDVVMVVDPQRVVIGGGVADAYDLFVDSARDSLRHELGAHWSGLAPEFARATLGVDAGTLGAADLAGRGRSAPLPD